MIVQVNVVLNRPVVVDSDLTMLFTQSLSTTTILFRTTFTRAIKLNLRLKDDKLFFFNNIFKFKSFFGRYLTRKLQNARPFWQMLRNLLQIVASCIKGN